MSSPVNGGEKRRAGEQEDDRGGGEHKGARTGIPRTGTKH